ncbi:MarR family winged helix-turn-helix transcriptional regulator [Pelagibacterium halotolerans]|uniref:MarR family winged helix-turn-helix transcriptional regulator n=1 Tax=Pelagibacterium halotolerans TaxID=531813 RepID=UPI00384E5495
MIFDRRASAGYMTNWAARLFARVVDRRLKSIGVSSGYMPVFFALGDGSALTQKALAEIAAIEQPTMAATLKRMERDGLLERRPDPADRRSALIALTPVAREKAREVQQAVRDINAAALSQLSEDERAAYLDMLARITKSLEAAD